MPGINRTLLKTFSCRPFIIFPSRHFSSHPILCRDTQFRRSDFSGQGFTGVYEPGAPTVGPLSHASKHGAPRLTPSMLKEHLDKFVVGQDKAKKVTSVAIYNHYQRIRELRRQEAEEAERRAQKERRLLAERERNSHPVENEFPGHVETVDLNYRTLSESEPELGSNPLSISTHTIIEKSNLLLLGPSGVGKTYILATLARILEVPFATVDCSALTQAGYIGTDIESSIERLLLASNHNISKCESGIIFFDEVDKLAKPAIMTHGRDVSGEGVQQGLLKMIEGTSVTVNAKSDRNSRTEANSRGSDRMDRGGRDGGVGQPGGKSEQYTIDTSNILFVFAGAFVGLDRIVSSRLSSGTSIGFGAQLKHASSTTSSPSKPKRGQEDADNPLQNILPTDLQTYGLIPELLGRIPIITSLHPLTLPQLVSILTEPKNSLVRQYTALFATYGIQLRFTTPALHAIAERALSNGSPSPSPSTSSPSSAPRPNSIGARGLRSIMESVLGEIMFWGPGSSIRYCLIDETFVRGHDEGSSQFKTRAERSRPLSPNPNPNNLEDPRPGPEREDGAHDAHGAGKAMMPRCWSRGQGRLFEEAWEREEERWRVACLSPTESESGEQQVGDESVSSFEQFREVGRSGM